MLRSRVWLIMPALVVTAILDAGQIYLKELVDQDLGVDWRSILLQGSHWLILGALTPIAWYLARRFPLSGVGWKRALGAHVVGALALWAGWASLGLALSRAIDHPISAGHFHQVYVNWLLTSLPWSVFMYFAVLGSVYAFEYFDEARDREVQTAMLGAQLAEARLGALRMQLHPHFLFNSLNAVTVLVRERNTRVASRMLELLGELLQELLRKDRPQEVALSDELRLVEKYLAVERMRFSDRLRIVWSIKDRASAALVPDLILQPLVENAIRHGVGRRAGPARIEVSAHVDGPELHLSVHDDCGGLCDQAVVEGVGLSNTRERLRTLYGDLATLTLQALDGGTVASITLPFRTQE